MEHADSLRTGDCGVNPLECLAKTLRSGVLWFVLGVLAACSASETVRSVDSGPAVATVYVVDRGWHTDIGLSADDVRGPLAALKQPFPGVRYLTFGFGERAFYVSRHTDLLTMLSAMFPSQAAILVTGLRATPAQAFGQRHVVALPLTADGLVRLDAFLWSYLRKQPGGQLQLLAPGPYPGSLFYAAAGTYNATFTCNTWTADGLRAAGLPISTEGVVFADQVMSRVRALLTGGRPAAGTNDRGAWRQDDGVRRGGWGIAAAEAETASEQEREQHHQ